MRGGRSRFRAFRRSIRATGICHIPARPRGLRGRASPHAHANSGDRRRGPADGTRHPGVRQPSAPPDRPAWRDRPLRRRQDCVHHGAGARSHARRPAAFIRAVGLRAHRPGAARAAARRRGAAVRVRAARRCAGQEPRLAGIDAPRKRAAARRRISVPQRHRPHAHPRYRRLSRRVAARSAAARHELSRMVGPGAEALLRGAAPQAREPMARTSCRARPGSRRGRAGGAHRRKAVHRLPSRLPRRALCAEPAAARPVPDAGRTRRRSGFHLRAACARRRGAARQRLAPRHDGAPVRGLQRFRGAAVLSRAFRPVGSPGRAGGCLGGTQRRARGRQGPRSHARGDPRLLPSCLPRPRPIICTTRATTGSSAFSPA